MDETSHDEIRAALMGHSVTKVSDDSIQLDDGTVLTLVPNEGGCSCSAGDYELTELNECPDNAIMNVEFEHEIEPDTYDEGDQSFKVFVLAADRRIKLWQIDGNDGNGYYGTGYTIRVTANG
jgi:hypothetical protein